MLIAMLTAVCARMKIANRHRMLPLMAICGVNSNGWVLGSHRRNTDKPQNRTGTGSFVSVFDVGSRAHGARVRCVCLMRLFAPRRRLPRCS